MDELKRGSAASRAEPTNAVSMISNCEGQTKATPTLPLIYTHFAFRGPFGHVIARRNTDFAGFLTYSPPAPFTTPTLIS
jgi:hypothetical protein